MEKETLLVEELENRLAIEAADYKHRLNENWQTQQFDPNYFSDFIPGALYTEFVTAIYERIKPLNNHEINRYLTLSVAQFKTHTPEKRERAFILNFWHTYWFPNVMDDNVSEHDEKFAKHAFRHYTQHFHLFKDAAEKALADFKSGFIGFAEAKPFQNNETTVQDFFDKVKEGDLTQLEIYNQVQKFTDNFDLTKLEILFQDFGFYLFIEKEERLGECTDEQIQKALRELHERGKPVPYKKQLDIPTLNNMRKKGEPDKVLDTEALLYPFDFFTCYQFEKFLIEEIKKRRTKTADTVPVTAQNKKANNTAAPQSFDNLLTKQKAAFILQMLEDLSITLNGKSVLSQRRKGALRGIVEAAIEKNILPQLSIEVLCKLIADKIGLELKAKLDFSDISEKQKKAALSYIKEHYSA